MAQIAEKKIGVLALQGDFGRHEHQIRLLGAQSKQVRTAGDLDEIDALIMPGGESTTMNILLDRFEIRDRLRQFGRTRPIWGTCAGMIMLGKEIEDNQASVTPLGLMDISVIRNGYGRQVYSFEEDLFVNLTNGAGPIRIKATFIRAPRVTRSGKSVTILAEFQNSPVLLQEGNLMASSFHTELDDDTTLLAYFLQKFLQ